MKAVYKRELKSLFNGMTGYAVIALLLVFSGVFAWLLSLRGGSPYLESTVYYLSFLLLLVVPVLTMRSFAEEKTQKTDLLLYSLPLSSAEIVIGKYLALLTVFAIPTAITGLYPLVFSLYGSVGFASAYCSLLGYFLLGAALIAIGMFMSVLAENQVIAAVSGFGVMIALGFLYLVTTNFSTKPIMSYIALACTAVVIAAIVFAFTRSGVVAISAGSVLVLALTVWYFFDSTAFGSLFPRIFSGISLYNRFTSFTGTDLLDLSDVVYYISVSVLFCVFSVRWIEKRRRM